MFLIEKDVPWLDFDRSKEYMGEQFAADMETVLGSMATGEFAVEDAVALDQIILGYARDIYGQANKMRWTRSLEMADHMQVGIQGVYDAVARTDETRSPGELRAYAKLRIFSFIFEQQARMDGAVSLSDGGLKRVIKVRKIKKALEGGEAVAGDGDEIPDVDQDIDVLLEEYKFSRAQYEKYRAVESMFAPLSLEDQVDEDESVTPISENYAEDDPYCNDPASLLSDRPNLIQAWERLPERQQTVIDLYYFQGLKLYEIGEMLGVTESRVCQIHRQALKTLKLYLAPSYAE